MTDVTSTTVVTPRLGFVGVGWIGLNRLRSVLAEDCAEPAFIADPSDDAVRHALEVIPTAVAHRDFEALLSEPVDGVVLATPSGLHAEQAIRALDAGKAVFCQKPLGRTVSEVQAVIAAARRNDRLLGVDFSYRHVHAMQVVRSTIQSGDIGTVYAADLLFHNAYGPDKSWASDPDLAGGGCLIDLGIHLIDLLLWSLDSPRVVKVVSALFQDGKRLSLPTREIEDYAHAQIDLDGGTSARLACSWRFDGGRDAWIQASFYGTSGSVVFHNVDGSFYDFGAELHHGSNAVLIAVPPDTWSGRAIVDWVSRLSDDPGYDEGIEDVVKVAATIDMSYGRGDEHGR